MELPKVELPDSLYKDFMSRQFPMSDLLQTHGPVFKFTSPGNELHDAKNIDSLLEQIVSMDKKTLRQKGAIIRIYKYEVFKTANNNTVYRMSNRKPVKNTINMKSYVTTGKKPDEHQLDPLSTADIDKLCQLVSKKGIIYVHNVACDTNEHLDINVFHNPAEVCSPLALLKRKKDDVDTGISDHWVFVGKRYTNSFIHTDDFGIPVINTMLNNGSKLWMVIDPNDNDKMIEKLRSISGLDDSCPYNYLDTQVLIPASTLNEWGIKFYTCIQRQHETVVLGDNIFHQCITLDFSINVGTNFLSHSKCTEDTIYCQCPADAKHRHFDGVEINGPELLASWRARNF